MASMAHENDSYAYTAHIILNKGFSPDGPKLRQAIRKVVESQVGGFLERIETTPGRNIEVFGLIHRQTDEAAAAVGASIEEGFRSLDASEKADLTVWAVHTRIIY